MSIFRSRFTRRPLMKYEARGSSTSCCAPRPEAFRPAALAFNKLFGDSTRRSGHPYGKPFLAEHRDERHLNIKNDSVPIGGQGDGRRSGMPT
jgi:hypothetical protein